jgi:hypothetical protein
LVGRKPIDLRAEDGASKRRRVQDETNNVHAPPHDQQPILALSAPRPFMPTLMPKLTLNLPKALIEKHAAQPGKECLREHGCDTGLMVVRMLACRARAC